MTETTKIIGEYGILVAIAGVFLYTYVLDRKYQRQKDVETSSTLKLLSDATNNVAQALKLLEASSQRNEQLLNKHDERAIEMHHVTGIIHSEIIDLKQLVQNNNIQKRKKE